MRVLVTGGCGFIGSHVAEELLNRGFEVVVLDDLSLGVLDNIKGLNAEFIKGDAEIVATLNDSFDAIVHCGIPSSSPMYKRDPNLVAKAVKGMLSTLEYARKKKAKVVLASTSSIYNGNPIPWREDMEVRVTDFYTEARLYCERLCSLYAYLYDVEGVALRYFSVFGEREEHKSGYANVITQMIWAAIRGERFTIYGDGTQKRDLVYVRDVAEANIKALEFDDYTGSTRFEVFNIGSGTAYSFNDMARLLEAHLPVELVYRENPIPNYVHNTLADMSKSTRVLKFSPRNTVEGTLPQLVEYYKKVMASKHSLT